MINGINEMHAQRQWLMLAAGLVILQANCMKPARVEPAAPLRTTYGYADILSHCRGAETTSAIKTRDYLQACIDYAESHHTYYQARLIKQELVHGEMLPEQEILLTVREEPFAVDMQWQGSTGRARRVTYIAGEKTNNKGEPLARVEPANKLLGALGPLWLPIHGERMMRDTRKSIDQAGLRHTLRDIAARLKEYSDNQSKSSEKALPANSMWNGCRWDNREVVIVISHHPSGEHQVAPSTSPDKEPLPALVIAMIDAERKVPLAVFVYGDRAGQQLIARYEYRDIALFGRYTPGAFK